MIAADHLTIIHLAFCFALCYINSLLDPPFGYLRHSLLRTRKWHRLRHHERDRSHCLVFEIGRSILCQCSRGCWKPQEFGVFIKKGKNINENADDTQSQHFQSTITIRYSYHSRIMMWTVRTLHHLAADDSASIIFALTCYSSTFTTNRFIAREIANAFTANIKLLFILQEQHSRNNVGSNTKDLARKENF